MQNKLLKVIATSTVGIISLATSLVAGYKAYVNRSADVEILGEKTTLTPIPETKEVVENETVYIDITPTPSSSGTPTNTPIATSNIKSPQNNSPAVIPVTTIKPGEFDDDEDDEVIFEDRKNDNEYEKEDKD